jgi:hypothetical protein
MYKQLENFILTTFHSNKIMAIISKVSIYWYKPTIGDYSTSLNTS